MRRTKPRCRAPDAPAALARDQGLPLASPTHSSPRTRPWAWPRSPGARQHAPAEPRRCSGRRPAGRAEQQQAQDLVAGRDGHQPRRCAQGLAAAAFRHPGGAHGLPAGAPLQHPAFLPSHGLYTCHIGKFSS